MFYSPEDHIQKYYFSPNITLKFIKILSTDVFKLRGLQCSSNNKSNTTSSYFSTDLQPIRIYKIAKILNKLFSIYNCNLHMHQDDNIKRLLILSDLQESILTLSLQDLTLAIKESNISTITGAKFPEELSNELVKMFFEEQKKQMTSNFFLNLPILLHPLLRTRAEIVFKKYCRHQFSNQIQNQVCYCQQPLNNSKLVTICNFCRKICHNSCVFYPQLGINSECPACFIKNLDPLSEVSEVVFMRMIKLREKTIDFQINLSHLKIDEFVEFRCIKIDSDPLYNSQISWPDHCNIKINGIQYFKLRPLAFNNALKKREDKVFELPPTEFRRKTKVQIKIKTQHTGNKEFKTKNCVHLFSVVVVKKLSLNQLSTKVINTLSDKAVYSCALRERYKSKNSCIQLQKQKVGLSCPFTKTRIKIPSRGSCCLHLQCFDLNNFLAINKQSRLYKCPMFRCSERCHSLIVDPVLYDIIKQDKLQQIDFVEFSIHGHKIHKRQIQVINLDSDVQSSQKTQSIAETNPQPFQTYQIKKIQKEKENDLIYERAFQNPHLSVIQLDSESQIEQQQIGAAVNSCERTIEQFKANENTSDRQSVAVQSDNSQKNNIAVDDNTNQQNPATKNLQNKDKKESVLMQEPIQEFIEIKDSDDETEDEKYERYLQNSLVLLNEQRKRTQKKNLKLNKNHINTMKSISNRILNLFDL